MEYRRIGQLQVSVAGLGCNSFGRFVDEGRAVRTVHAALDHGVTFFDTADVYVGVDGSSEMHLARALGPRRDEVVLATKFGKDPFGDLGRSGASPRRIREAVDASLRRLQTDRIDLYQLHEPDSRVPIAETLGALAELVAAGKVREIGHSAFTADMIDEAARAAAVVGAAGFVSTQTEWSLLAREAEKDVVPAARRHNVSVLPYWPLSSGLLTGKYGPDGAADPAWRLARTPNRGHFLTHERVTRLAALRTFARESGRSLLELALSWLASRPEVASVIAGATCPEHAAANAAAVGSRLTDDELRAIDGLTRV